MKTKMKTKTICCRLEEEEKEYLKKLCDKTGKNESEILRQIIRSSMENSNKQFETKEHFLLRKELINEINRIGHNINQIVKNNNSHFYTNYEKEKLFALMNEIKRLMRQA